jgi:hypothetical protein
LKGRSTTRVWTSFRPSSGKSREAIEALVAELAPEPDVEASVRKLPACPAPPAPMPAPTQVTMSVPTEQGLAGREDEARQGGQATPAYPS